MINLTNVVVEVMRMREGDWVIGDWLDFAWALGDPPEDQRAYNII